MFQEFLSNSDHLVWPLLAFVMFFLTFVVVLVYVLSGVLSGRNFDHVASLPLSDDNSVPGGRSE
jgi:hypothetical protein